MVKTKSRLKRKRSATTKQASNSGLWTEAERLAWRWPERLQPSVWIETAPLYIPDNALNPEPGPYTFARTPYWREVVDLIAEAAVREVYIYKANQVGFTQLMLALLAYWAAQDPGAAGLLMPDEDSVNEIFEEQLIPTIKATPELRKLRSARAWDATKDGIWLSSMPIFGLWAGSDSKLEKRPLRYVVGDEVNIYRGSSTNASAIQRLLKRITNWGHKGRAVFGSKPTTADGNITLGYQSCPDKRRYFMPCARCGRYQDWKWEQVRGFRDAPGADKNERANWVIQNQPCFYECEFCKKHTLEHEKAACVAAGRWVSGVGDGVVEWKPTQQVTDGGVVKGDRPISARVGLHLWAIVSPWLSMSKLAAEFIEAEGDPDKTRGFRNARRALPWDEVVKTTRASVVRDRLKIAPKPVSGMVIVPKWATAIYATFDTQKDWFAGVIRAWGWGFRSQLLWYGQCNTFDEVFARGLQSHFRTEDGGVAQAKVLLIDSGGDRTNAVYDFASRDPRIYPTKGESGEKLKLWRDTQVRPGVQLRLVNVSHFKSALWNLLHDADKTKWLPHSEVPEQYCLEMASESLVVDPKTRNRVWQKTGSARNEAWDLEVLQRAAAEMDGIGASQAPATELDPSGRPDPDEYTNPMTSHIGKWGPK